MIKADSIVKQFAGRIVLDHVSVAFEPGRTNLIIGRSGSGKTVLMKCLVGLLEVDEGEIYYNNRLFSKMTAVERRPVRQELGMLFQGGALFDSMNVVENVMFPLNMYTNDSRADKQKRVDFCLERVNLSQAARLMPSELSGGMVKRVAIARAISLNPRYLFCDEPNSGLDPQTATLIDNLILEITRESNITTVINTHDMNSVLQIGDHVHFIHEGKLWWQGDKTNILDTENSELNQFLFSTELTRRLKKN